MLQFTSKIILILILVVVSTISIAQTSSDSIDKNKLSAYFQNEQYAEAVQYLEDKNVFKSTDQNSLNDLGYAYYMSKRFMEAQQVYAKTLSLDSLNFIANKYLAYISQRDKNYKIELLYCLRLIRIQPLTAALYKFAGDTYSKLNNDDTATLYYAHAYNLSPKNETIVSAYAENLIERELYVKADSVSTEFIKTDSLNYTMVRLAIRIYIAEKKMREAAALTPNWLIINEEDPKTAVYLAQANYSIKNYKDAFIVCDTLLKQGIETESLLYYDHKLSLN
ncbi:MAG TPA: hypothetical protein VF623_05460 [Segetibacter sp.]|jgi:uncharacterized protein HemY